APSSGQLPSVRYTGADRDAVLAACEPGTVSATTTPATTPSASVTVPCACSTRTACSPWSASALTVIPSAVVMPSGSRVVLRVRSAGKSAEGSDGGRLGGPAPLRGDGEKVGVHRCRARADRLGRRRLADRCAPRPAGGQHAHGEGRRGEGRRATTERAARPRAGRHRAHVRPLSPADAATVRTAWGRGPGKICPLQLGHHARADRDVERCAED